jgi:hypothetical protein
VHDLLTRLSEANSSGQLNRARIDLHRFGTPQEVVASLHIECLPPDTADWLRRLSEHCFNELPEPAPYTRVASDERWSLYQLPADTARRELVVGFGGAWGGLFQPVPVVLQYLGGGARDLLLLRDHDLVGQLDATEGKARVEEILELVAETTAGYSSTMTLGASKGGASAIITGLIIGARTSVATGARFSDEYLAALRSVLPERHRSLLGDRSESRRAFALYGDGCDPDRRAAHDLQAHIPSVQTVELTAIGSHNAPHEAFQQGRLRSLYSLIVDGPPAAPDRRAAGDVGRLHHVVDLTRSCEPPAWASAPEAPRRWDLNTEQTSRRALSAIELLGQMLPRRWARTIEQFALDRFGVVVHAQRLGNTTVRAAAQQRILRLVDRSKPKGPAATSELNR